MKNCLYRLGGLTCVVLLAAGCGHRTAFATRVVRKAPEVAVGVPVLIRPRPDAAAPEVPLEVVQQVVPIGVLSVILHQVWFQVPASVE